MRTPAVQTISKSVQPADEQNIPVLKTRNASIRRPTCKPNFLQTALKIDKQNVLFTFIIHYIWYKNIS